MKRITIILIGLFVMACGSNEQGDAHLQELRLEKDSLLKVKAEIENRIKAINQEIGDEAAVSSLMQVTTKEVNKGDFNHYLEVYGNIESAQNVLIYPESAGVITSIDVEEGQSVTQGQILGTMDAEVLKSNLKEVETNLELATTIYEKQKRLHDKEIGSEVAYLEAKNRKESLESTRATIQAQIKMSVIRAPFSGIVDEIFPKEGEMGNMGMPFLRLVNLDNIYVKADVSEEYLRSIKVGTEAIVEITNLDTSIVAKVNQVGQFINPNNRTFKVRIELNNGIVQLKPNLLTKIRIKDFEVKDEAITIPSRMLQQTPDGNDYVMLYKNGVVEKRMVKTGVSYQAMTLITEGLNDGDILIDKGARSVNDGQNVAVAS
ncbi:MAG: efflux transporter periplasmic adaptor subunit [Flavobacteriales bacterium]|nr:efflux transporter periplasmic adaptor subunit [Flavobacteriales bacterium]